MDKIRQADIALHIAGFNFKKQDLEKIMKSIEMAGPETTLDEIVTLIENINAKYEK